MNDDVTRRLYDFIEKDNALEMEQRLEYYRYLVETQGETQSFEEFAKIYGGLGAFGSPVADAVIEDFGPAIPFPGDLVTFYRTHGSLRGLERQLYVTIFDLDTLNQNRTETYNKPLFRSLGLVDMIEYLWGDRDQITPASGRSMFTPQQIDHLNQTYQVIGYWVDANETTEALHLLYYDSTGQFGIAYVHQDEWAIAHLLETSRAQYSLEDALAIYLDTMESFESGED